MKSNRAYMHGYYLPCKWLFYSFFSLSPLSTLDSPHSLFLISFLTLFSLINSLSKMISISDPTIRLASLIKYSGDSDGPWFRSASLISDHMKTTSCLGKPWSDDRRPWLSERRWFRQVCSIWLLMVVGGWVWVILGLCWVCSLTEKTMANWVWVILLKDGCGCASTDFVEGWLVRCGCGSTKKTSLWVCSRGKEIIKNAKKMNILLNKCVE